MRYQLRKRKRQDLEVSVESNDNDANASISDSGVSSCPSPSRPVVAQRVWNPLYRLIPPSMLKEVPEFKPKGSRKRLQETIELVTRAEMYLKWEEDIEVTLDDLEHFNDDGKNKFWEAFTPEVKEEVEEMTRDIDPDETFKLEPIDSEVTLKELKVPEIKVEKDTDEDIEVFREVFRTACQRIGPTQRQVPNCPVPTPLPIYHLQDKQAILNVDEIKVEDNNDNILEVKNKSPLKPRSWISLTSNNVHLRMQPMHSCRSYLEPVEPLNYSRDIVNLKTQVIRPRKMFSAIFDSTTKSKESHDGISKPNQSLLATHKPILRPSTFSRINVSQNFKPVQPSKMNKSASVLRCKVLKPSS